MENEIKTKINAAKEASRRLASAGTESKNEALLRIADALIKRQDEILSQNAFDVREATERMMTEQMTDRLRLDEKRLLSAAEGVRQVAALPDPIGEIIEEFERPNGLHIKKVRVPLGVIGMIYEARPNVTVDAAVLSLKAGSACVLRGSSSAISSNKALASVIRDAVSEAGLPKDSVCLIESASHDAVAEMISQRGGLDLVIPRGGAGLIRRVTEESRVPVLETGVGNCHIYVDRDADLKMARDIVINAKTQRPSVCNAAETLLVHREREDLLVSLCRALSDAGVTIHGTPEVCALVPDAVPAGERDFAEEYLSLDMAAALVSDVDGAVEHIKKYGTGHTEAIITNDTRAAEKFVREVDAAVVNVNASTRFTDGFEFGFGAEIGISTQKMHARGPLGLREITSYKYVVEGKGQIRQ